MKKVAVVLAGCGVYDGSEIYETVITLLSLDSHEAQYQCFAPDIEQLHVINHKTGEVMDGESRNVLIEAARLARGEIKDLTEAKAEDFDALIFPGGFGVAKNLCNFATEGTNMTLNPEVARIATEFAEAGKPAGYICIAPTMVASIYNGAQCTIGNNAETAAAIESMGATHVDCPVDDIVIDEENKVITTPAYMLASRISEAAAGIEKLVRQILEMAQ
ncbi:isoprenoid biosynthesis protein with amidotransferase-like domain [Oleiphilus messinensis]|uniref:Glyoxalase n=1 Tax=Oleiphilus messinensis TaxID=141451 RepID=A0A1Y0IB83_9GAMM|nr:isoprenoid biosynthesis glyoxalase ElbB [Oleiphilus messinensis]ARU57026.1 isoprenoid biosynthesis protein with amidotransferase-like domain [Oleiphilus messinensis]